MWCDIDYSLSILKVYYNRTGALFLITYIAPVWVQNRVIMQQSLYAIPLAETASLTTLIENRSAYTMDECELNVFETHRPADKVSLVFSDFVFTSMLRGKKVMHLYGKPGFNYCPGESVLVPSNETIEIDFPEADENNPTQCLALAISGELIGSTIDLLNEKFPKVEANESWQFRRDNYHLVNSSELTDTLNRIIFISLKEHSRAKDVLVSLNLRELLVRLMQTQARAFFEQNYLALSSQHRFAAVIRYIKEHLHETISMAMLSKKAFMSRTSFFRNFKYEFGMTPLEYIQQERMRLARSLLRNPVMSVTEVALQVGYNDLNNFIRTFRKWTGETPGGYRASINPQQTNGRVRHKNIVIQ